MLEEGTSIGSYVIAELLGAGGMGEVYRANDTRLKRDVAIKILSERLLEDADAPARFEREAQSVAALSHPNILAIHDFGRFKNMSYAVMELLEGETLRELMRRVPPSSGRAIEIGLQIAAGLVAAHGRGIVHRDLKPENIFVTREGLVKILDFGLARQVPVPWTTDSESEASTLSNTLSSRVVGTLGYMSPEQLRARPVDHRSDIFSFGVVLYEMLSGRRPFEGETSADVLGAILADEPPPLSAAGSSVPPSLSRIVGRCLEKDARDRFQSASDLAFALKAVRVDESAGDDSGSPPVVAEGVDTSSSLAVLRFSNMSPDPEQEYFCEGMAEEIINALGSLEGLRVAARSSAFQFDAREIDAREVARKLKVKAVLEGSVRTAGKRVRVSVQLIDAVNGFQLWSESYDREMDDIFALQDEISRRVVQALTSKLSAPPKEEAKRPTTSVEAYHLYLKGFHNWYKRDKDSLKKAASLFERAADEDPSYALAHAAVALTHTNLAYYGMEPWVARTKVNNAMSRAVALDPAKPEVRAVVGLRRMILDWDWAGAERELKAAIDANPSNPLAACWYTLMLAWTGRGDESAEVASRAVEIDPLSPYTNALFGLGLVSAGRPEDALKALTGALEIDSDYLLAHWVLTATCIALGRPEDAVPAAERAVVLSGRSGFYLGWLGWSYGVAGREDEAGEVLGELTSRLAGGEYVQPTSMVQANVGLGRSEKAFEWLERAVEVGDPQIASLCLHCLDPLRDDPRLQIIRERVGIPTPRS
jgi:serine/threonine-protein kinase